MRHSQKISSMQGTSFGFQSIVFSRLDMSSWTLFVKQITATNTVPYRTVPFSYLRYERMYIFIRIYICKESRMNLRKVRYRTGVPVAGMVWYGMVWYGMVSYGTVPTYRYRNGSLFGCSLP